MTEFRTPFQAGSSLVYNADVMDADGDPVLVAQITSILMTIVDENEEPIDSTTAVEVFNQNGGIYTDGHFQLTIGGNRTDVDPDDVSDVQTRYLHLRFIMVGGAVEPHEVLWYIQNNHIPGDD